MKKNLKEIASLIVTAGISAATTLIFNYIKNIVSGWFKSDN
jgi:hypothetical protein